MASMTLGYEGIKLKCHRWPVDDSGAIPSSSVTRDTKRLLMWIVVDTKRLLMWIVVG